MFISHGAVCGFSSFVNSESRGEHVPGQLQQEEARNVSVEPIQPSLQQLLTGISCIGVDFDSSKVANILSVSIWTHPPAMLCSKVKRQHTHMTAPAQVFGVLQ